MSRRVAHNFVIIFHLGNTIAFFLHFTVLQRLNHLPTLWGFDWSSAELGGQAEKSICKETRRKFNPGAAAEATMAAASSLGVCPAAQTQCQPPARKVLFSLSPAESLGLVPSPAQGLSDGFCSSISVSDQRAKRGYSGHRLRILHLPSSRETA